MPSAPFTVFVAPLALSPSSALNFSRRHLQVARDLASLDESSEQAAYQQLGRGQIEHFARLGASWYFWTWKVDSTDEPHWDLRE